jgi:hypothetical protein
MIPVMLDVLTILFIVGGVLLLWLNLREWRTMVYLALEPALPQALR